MDVIHQLGVILRFRHSVVISLGVTVSSSVPFDLLLSLSLRLVYVRGNLVAVVSFAPVFFRLGPNEIRWQK